MNLLDYARQVRRLWWVIIATLVLGAAAGYALALVTPRTYTVREVMLVTVIGDGAASSLQSGNVFAMQRAPSYARLAVSRDVLDRALQELQPGSTLDDLRNSVTATALDNSGIIDIDVSGGDAETVKQIAVAVGNALAAVAKETDTPGIQSTIDISSIDTPAVPTTAASPQPRTSVVIGSLVGILVGIGVIILLTVVDTRIRSMGDLMFRSFASRTAVPRVRRQRDLATRDVAIHRLRANLRFGPGLARTTAVFPASVRSDYDVAWSLAASLVEVGSRVVLVDIDPTRAAGRDRRTSGTNPGLTDVLTDAAVLSGAVIDLDYGLSYLGIGQTPSLLASLISGEAMPHLLSDLVRRYDRVILRCPPVLDHSETAVLAALADANVIVVAAAQTTRAELRFGLEALDGVRATELSVVLDGLPANDLRAAVTPTILPVAEFTRS